MLKIPAILFSIYHVVHTILMSIFTVSVSFRGLHIAGYYF